MYIGIHEDIGIFAFESKEKTKSGSFKFEKYLILNCSFDEALKIKDNLKAIYPILELPVLSEADDTVKEIKI